MRGHNIRFKYTQWKKNHWNKWVFVQDIIPQQKIERRNCWMDNFLSQFQAIICFKWCIQDFKPIIKSKGSFTKKPNGDFC